MSKASKRRKALPLDSPNWMPIDDAHVAISGVTGNRKLAEIDLSKVLRDGSLPYLRRDLRTGERELGAREFWDKNWLTAWSDRMRISGPARHDLCALFCWRPALAKLWPYVTAFASPQPARGRRRRTRSQAEQAEPTPAAAAEQNDPAEPPVKRQRREPPVYEKIRTTAAEIWPNGYDRIGTPTIIYKVGNEFIARKESVPSRDQFLRALRRRKD